MPKFHYVERKERNKEEKNLNQISKKSIYIMYNMEKNRFHGDRVVGLPPQATII